MFNPNIKKGELIDNSKLCQIFGCSSQGGMRRSHSTNTLVLVSNRITSIYEDVWEGNILYYTGMGQSGDQVLSGNQNKTLFESESNGVSVFLFEVFEDKKYFYQGEFKLAKKPYQGIQSDVDNKPRKVWIFPIQSVDFSSPIAVPEELLNQKRSIRQKQVSKLNEVELLKKIEDAPEKCSSRTIVSNQFERNEYVAEYAKKRAKGICQLCKNKAPFNNNQGEPYLEVHHVVWLSKGGADNIKNTVALCPNCHKKMHILNIKQDVETLHSSIGISKIKI